MTELTHPQRKDIEKAIDAFGMNHSLMLPKDKMGYTDWTQSNTLSHVLQVLTYRQGLAIAYAERCDQLAEVVKEVRMKKLEETLGCFKKAVSDD